MNGGKVTVENSLVGVWFWLLASAVFSCNKISKKQNSWSSTSSAFNEKCATFLLALFAVSNFLFPSAASQGTDPIWVNETRLGKYQDAWKILNQTEVYYLVKSTFNSADYLWGKNFTCVNVRHEYTNNTARRSNFTFQNMSSSQTPFNLNLLTLPFNTYDYKRPNAIQYQLHNCSLLNDTVIFSDGETCNLLSIPYENNGKGCELWVKEEYLRNGTTPQCCYFLFDLLCADIGSYDISNKDCYSNPKY
uniref:Lipocalin/cytosolic fatty-acid binding domain-containing protein n=1 Tax=Amblyomma maculatum TaxID=34609 RepID=G3MPA3_AMBMU